MGAELATEIDRIALCTHQPTGRRKDLMAELAPLAMPGRSIVVVAARFLAAGRLRSGDLALMSRYDVESKVSRVLDADVRRGLLVDNGDDGFVPSPEFRSAAELVLRLQGEEAERLWSSNTSLARLNDLAHAHAAAARGSDLPLPAFRRQCEVHVSVPPSDAGQLLAHTTELRYLRADIHAQCLADEGLSGPSARMLHRLWRGFDLDGDLDRSLITAGLVEERAKPILTDHGKEVCEKVEATTNEDFARVFDSVDVEQSSDLLSGMRGLAGEDPRPAEDR